MTADQAASASLYRKEAKIYPREVHGRYARLRRLSVWVLLGLFYLLPWINWDGHQAVLFDLPARKFHVFALTFWPQDFIYLAVLLIMAGLSLFFFTALAGRLWCGFACPQTVWTEVFMWIETWIEGGRGRRMKLDRAPWTGEKITKKGLKHLVWIFFSLWTGFTFVGFFTPIQELGDAVLTLSLGPWETFWGFFYSAATYGNAGFLREQVCKYMCPYARFQSAMFDRDTLIISYDAGRGEPRGGRRKSADRDALGLGDCIDCTLCVQVCPTGIDIREGLQYECIACAACVDVCNQVMDKMEYPRGLIRYTTERSLAGGNTRVLRPRTVIYAILLTVLLAGWFWSLANRTPLRAELMRDRNALYRELPDGGVANIYALKLINMDSRPHRIIASTPGRDDIAVSIAPEPLLDPEQVGQFSLRLTVPGDSWSGAREVKVQFRAEDDPSIRLDKTTRMMLPFGEEPQ